MFAAEIRPLLERHCFECHNQERRKGDLDLSLFQDEAAVLGRPEVFERVLQAVRAQEMPPRTRPQPTLKERELLVGWLETAVFPVDCRKPDPGRVTVRRLNRAEYNNTIRDLVGVSFEPAADFPADDAGYGFDNIGDVLSLPPMLLEKYLAAAERILQEAVVTDGRTPSTEPHRRIFGDSPRPGRRPEAEAREVIGRFAARAYRRPVTAAETERLMELYRLGRSEGEGFEGGVRLALQAVLVSPHFLFRGEPQPEPDNPRAVHPINEFALASRLSYFLWSSLPDEELTALASRRKLRRQLEAQVRRMLRDPKAAALVEQFAGQWLQLRNLDLVQPDAKEFPAFTPELRGAMRRETELLFAEILREDRSVLEFLDAKYTFLNGPLARHYGIEGVEGPEFRRVSLEDTARGGVLTHASVLTLTSNPTRTSPVKRGKWVLENLLGSPPPPPPPNVPELDAGQQAALRGTLRQRMEQHRENPQCAPCHERMDPIGFGLEHFDGIGAWRARDGAFEIDASGQLVTGESFHGAAELRAILAEHKRELFVRCLASKMLTYALGRGLEYYDRCALDRVVEAMETGGYRFSVLVLEVVKSVPFQMRRGEGDPRRR